MNQLYLFFSFFLSKFAAHICNDCLWADWDTQDTAGVHVLLVQMSTGIPQGDTHPTLATHTTGIIEAPFWEARPLPSPPPGSPSSAYATGLTVSTLRSTRRVFTWTSAAPSRRPLHRRICAPSLRTSPSSTLRGSSSVLRLSSSDEEDPLARLALGTPASDPPGLASIASQTGTHRLLRWL
jgi:hypothetical protein